MEVVSRAKAKYIKISPYKLRPIVDVIRGKRIDQALAWLKTYAVKRVVPIQKVLISAYSNARDIHKNTVSIEALFIKEIKVDQGPVMKYYKPTAMGRSAAQKKRTSHIEVVLGRYVENKDASHKEKIVTKKRLERPKKND